MPIIHERSEDANHKNKDLKAKIYYIALKAILQHIYSYLFFNVLKKMRHWEYFIAFLESGEEHIEIVYADGYKRGYYLILAGLMIGYKE